MKISLVLNGLPQLCSPGGAMRLSGIFGGTGRLLLLSANLAVAMQSQSSQTQITPAEQLTHNRKYQRTCDLQSPLEFFERSIDLKNDSVPPHLRLAGPSYFALGQERSQRSFSTGAFV